MILEKDELGGSRLTKEFNRATGIFGEIQAAQYLKKKKYKILAKNFMCVLGEIDIVAQQKKTIVFVEVKKRETLRFGWPREAVDEYKQEKIRKVALYYLKQFKLLESPVRFDVIEIIGDNINHIENAF